MIRLKQLLVEVKGYKVYCDMDGVLCDFEKQYKSVTGMTAKKANETLSAKEFWAPINGMGASFWSTMDWMKDGEKLWKGIEKYNPSILSCPSSDYSSRVGKLKWLNKNIPGLSDNQVHFACNKQKYASPNSILIDDFPEKINAFVAAGGIGILHKSTSETLKELKKILGDD